MKKPKRKPAKKRSDWWIRANTLSRKQQARCVCDDCGVNVIKIGEYFMLNANMWENQLGPGAWDNLCIGCIEARLGRKIWFPDMCNVPNYPWMRPISDRLRDRFRKRSQWQVAAEKRLQTEKTCARDQSGLRNLLTLEGRDLRQAGRTTRRNAALHQQRFTAPAVKPLAVADPTKFCPTRRG
jgi:hypothetical protein